MSVSTFLPLQNRAETFPAYYVQKSVQPRAKRGRGKAVTWPPEDQICQIRLFLSNDIPSSIGYAQNVCEMTRLRGSGAQSSAPPGLRSSLAKRARVDAEAASMSIGVPWACPEKFILRTEWLVADGDESGEGGLQKQRDLTVLEAVYPRLTSIPESPAEPVETCIALHDSLVPAVPLVVIEEEGIEMSKESDPVSETSGSGEGLDEQSENGKLPEGLMLEILASKTSFAFSQELSQQVQDPLLGSADPKVTAAASVASACMAVHTHGATGLVDPGLLVEILRNPALLKSLAVFNQVSKSPAGHMNGREPRASCLMRQEHPQSLKCHAVPPMKVITGVLNSSGIPSPVSVLADWTTAKPTESMDAPTVPPSGGALLSTPKHALHSCSSREAVIPSETEPAHGLHVRSQYGAGMGNTGCTSSVCAPLMPALAHADRSSGGVVAPITPFPSKTGFKFHAGRVPSSQGPSSEGGRFHPQRGPFLDSRHCRSSHPESRFRCKDGLGACGSTKTVQRTTRLCLYFNSPRGCRNGRNCAFVHQSGSSEMDAIAQ